MQNIQNIKDVMDAIQSVKSRLKRAVQDKDIEKISSLTLDLIGLENCLVTEVEKGLKSA